jgi:hypothetical protein
LASWEELDLLDREAKKTVKDGQKRAWEDYRNSIDDIRDHFTNIETFYRHSRD